MISWRKSSPEAISCEPSWLGEVTIRLAREEDLPALEWNGEYRHFRNVFAQAWQRAQSGLTLLWIAELSKVGLIGQAFIQLICDRPELADGRTRAYLYSFRVRSPYRDQGLGSRILETVENDLRQRGFRYVTLNVSKDNPRAQKLYRRRGYRIVASEAGYWSYVDENGQVIHMHEPAWRMIKRL